MRPEHDLFYEPAVATFDTAPTPIRNVLVHGVATDAHVAAVLGLKAADVRQFSSKLTARSLHRGTYGIRDFTTGEWDLLIALDGKDPVSASSDNSRFCDTHLAEVPVYVEDFWEKASPFVGASPIPSGAFVRLRQDGRLGRVQAARRTSTGFRVDVEIDGRLLEFDPETLEVLTGDPRRPEFWAKEPAVGVDETARLMTFLKLANPLTNLLYSFAATKTTFKPYQFIPVLKILRSAEQRMLIADEVGLGKTIEAGLIWTELEQRQPIRRALVVVPAALRFKWQDEMRNRFMRPLELIDRRRLADFLEQFERGEDAPLVGIISMETLRGAREELEMLARLAPQFDLAIVDEAHSLRNRGTQSNAVGNLLSDLADCLIFLSATPLNLHQFDLYNLLSLLDEGGFPSPEVFLEQLEPNALLNAIASGVVGATPSDRRVRLDQLSQIERMGAGRALASRPDFGRLRTILDTDEPLTPEAKSAVRRLVANLNTLGSVLSRTRKADVPDRKVLREATEVEVQWTPAERDFYQAVYEYYANKALKSRTPSGFLMQMPLRQVCSSLPVARQRLLQKEGWSPDDYEDEGLASGGGSPGETHGEHGIPPVPNAALRRGIDSKYDRLLETLRDARVKGLRQVLIFSFFRGTVDYLADRLSREFTTERLHGGIREEERRQVIARFRSGAVDLLIANQVGSEGLDFQFCNVLVNYDLPWNPMQVEQRIGRLDRVGQAHDKIFIFNMHVPGTIESDIIGRLYHRIGVFERSIGELEPILRSGFDDLARNVLNPTLSERQRAAEVERFNVAMENQAQNVKEIENSTGLLTTFGQLEIEGLTEAGPEDGRYIGSSELRRLILWLCQALDGTLIERSQRSVLVGSPQMARALQELPTVERGSGMSMVAFMTRIRNEESIEITFDPEEAQSLGRELITSSHPLIRLAVHRLRAGTQAMRRMGRVGLASLPAGSEYLARVDLANSNGVQPLCELWVTAVTLPSGEQSDDVEAALMSSLANGEWVNIEQGDSRPGTGALRRIEELLEFRRSTVADERQRENEALVEARIQSERRALEIKLRRVDEILRVHRHQLPQPIFRMNVSRAKNLEQQLAEVEARYESKRNISLTLEFGALIHVVGLGPDAGGS